MRSTITFLFLLCSLFAQAQNNIKKTAGINYTQGIPTTTPNEATASEFAIDTITGFLYQWHRTAGPSNLGGWRAIGQGIDVRVDAIPPTYTPFRNQSRFVVNGVDSLYFYRNGAWRHLNAGGGGATDIGYVDNGGNEVNITSSTGNGFTVFGVGGVSIYDDGGSLMIDGGSPESSKWTDGGATTYLTATTDKVGIGTTSAGVKLEVKDATQAQIRLTHTSGTKFTNIQTDASGNLFFENTGGSYLWGAGAPEAGELFRLGQTYTGTGAHYGMNTQFTFDPSGSVSAGLYGHQFRANYIGSQYMQNCNTFFARTTIRNTEATSNYIAFRGYTELLAGGAAGNLVGASFELDHAGSGVITSYKGFEANLASNSGTITNTYGYYCGDITTGTQTNRPYAIYCSDPNASSYFNGQVGVGATVPDVSAVLDVQSTTQGVLFPRMTTTQRDAIGTPADGLVIFNTTDTKLQVRAGGAWVNLH